MATSRPYIAYRVKRCGNLKCHKRIIRRITDRTSTATTWFCHVKCYETDYRMSHKTRLRLEHRLGLDADLDTRRQELATFLEIDEIRSVDNQFTRYRGHGGASRRLRARRVKLLFR